MGNRIVLGPTIYKNYCDRVGRDWRVPVRFTDVQNGTPVFKVLVVGFDERIRWALNPDQDLAEGQYF